MRQGSILGLIVIFAGLSFAFSFMITLMLRPRFKTLIYSSLAALLIVTFLFVSETYKVYFLYSQLLLSFILPSIAGIIIAVILKAIYVNLRDRYRA